MRCASRRAAAAVSGLVVTQGRPSCLGASVRCKLVVFVCYKFVSSTSTSLLDADVYQFAGRRRREDEEREQGFRQGEGRAVDVECGEGGPLRQQWE